MLSDISLVITLLLHHQVLLGIICRIICNAVMCFTVPLSVIQSHTDSYVATVTAVAT